MAQSIFQLVKERVTCRDVLAYHGTEYSGRDISCPLPGHDDGKPSFGLHDGDRAFKCHGCGAGGDVVTLEAHLTGVSNMEAAKAIAERVGIDPDAESPAPRKRKRRSLGEPVAIYDYRRPDGSLAHQTLRFEPKEFRQRRPDDKGGWIWSLAGTEPILYRWNEWAGEQHVVIVEGEKDADRVARCGLSVTTAPMGAGKWRDSYSEALRDKDLVILPDTDSAGGKHVSIVVAALTGVARSVRVAAVPDPHKDVSDWLDTITGDAEQGVALREVLSAAIAPDAGDTRPVVCLPQAEHTPFMDAAGPLGAAFAATGEHFNQGGALARVKRQEGESPQIEIVTDAMFVGEADRVARLRKYKKVGEKLVQTVAVMNQQTARPILCDTTFLGTLKPIKLVVPCAVLVPDGDRLGIAANGYFNGVYSTGETPPLLPLHEAVDKILSMFAEFDFATPSDRSRAVSLALTPAITASGIFKTNAPMVVVHANASQGGKTTLVGAACAPYNITPSSVAYTQKGGVGSGDETIGQLLLNGDLCILIDNVRGLLDSQFFESVLTADSITVRVPYRGPVKVDPRRTTFALTSNEMKSTQDLANRCIECGLVKRERFQYRSYPEGGLIEHIRANSLEYLGAIFTVLQEWYHRGQPRTNEVRHDRRQWIQPMDWIVQNIMGLPPLVDGLQERKAYMTDKNLVWLQQVAHGVIAADRAADWLTAHDLVEICESSGIEIPGSKGESYEAGDDMQRQQMRLQTGRRLSAVFKNHESHMLGRYSIEREKRSEAVTSDGGNAYTRENSYYRVSVSDKPDSKPDSKPVESLSKPVKPDSTPTIYNGDNGSHTPPPYSVVERLPHNRLDRLDSPNQQACGPDSGMTEVVL